MTRRFRQVDVFTDRLGYGNPLAVVADGDGLDDETMARFARWTNLSETTFVLTPTRSRWVPSMASDSEAVLRGDLGCSAKAASASPG